MVGLGVDEDEDDEEGEEVGGGGGGGGGSVGGQESSYNVSVGASVVTNSVVINGSVRTVCPPAIKVVKHGQLRKRAS